MRYFTFLELIKTNQKAENLPVHMEHVENLVCLADFLNDVREEFGEPIIVNSAFRTPVVNQLVGGVPNSLHLFGRAADIRPEYAPANDYKWRLLNLYQILKRSEDDLSELIMYDNFIHLAI